MMRLRGLRVRVSRWCRAASLRHVVLPVRWGES